MDVLFLMNNGKIKKKGKHIDLENVNSVLIELKSSLFGTAFWRVSPKAYKKYKKIRMCKFKYKFCNGCPDPTSDETFNEDEKILDVKRNYMFANAPELLASIAKIVISEDVYNDVFWSSSSFQEYYHHDIHLKYKIKNKKFKFNNLDKFLDKNRHWVYKEPYNVKSGVDQPLAIEIHGKKYTFLNTPECDKDGEVYALYRESIYFRMNPKFWRKLKSFKIDTSIWMLRYDENEKIKDWDSMLWGERENLITPTQIINNYCKGHIPSALSAYFIPYVLDNIPSNSAAYDESWHAVSLLEEINGHKNNPDEYRFDEFINKYFPDIPIYNDNHFCKDGIIELEEDD